MAGSRVSPRPLSSLDRALIDIQSDDTSSVVRAAKVLAGDYESSTDLVKLLSSERRTENRHGILYALSWHGLKELWPIALEIVGNTSEAPVVRGQAAEAISYLFAEFEVGSSEFKRAVEVLVVATRDASPEVRYCAVNALGCSGDLSLVPLLEVMLGDVTPVPGWAGTVGEEAARAIEWVREMAQQRMKRASQVTE